MSNLKRFVYAIIGSVSITGSLVAAITKDLRVSATISESISIDLDKMRISGNIHVPQPGMIDQKIGSVLVTMNNSSQAPYGVKVSDDNTASNKIFLAHKTGDASDCKLAIGVTTNKDPVSGKITGGKFHSIDKSGMLRMKAKDVMFKDETCTVNFFAKHNTMFNKVVPGVYVANVTFLWESV